MTLTLKLSLFALLIIPYICYAETPAQTLYLLGYDIPKNERESVIQTDIEAYSNYQRKRLDSTFFNPFKGSAPQSKLNNYSIIDTRELKLCSVNSLDSCINDIKKSIIPYEKSMQILTPVFADINKLRQSEPQHLTSIFPTNLQLTDNPIPHYKLLAPPILTQSVLAYHNEANQGIIQICDNVILSKKLIESKESFIQSLIGKALLDSHLDLLTRTSAPLPTSCVEALKPFTDKIVSICPLVEAESKQAENLYMGLVGVPFLYSRKATIKQVRKETALYCNHNWQSNVTADNLATPPNIKPYEPWLFNKIGATLLNIAKPDYTHYQNRLQDTNAYLRLWQQALDPQCATDSELFVNSIKNNWNSERNLRLDGSQRLTINNYDTKDRENLSVSCRTVQ